MSGIIHHGFDESPESFEAKKAWPIKGTKDWKGEYASQSPLNQMHLSREGGGAEGTPGYLALVGDHSREFYAEASPRWYRPRVWLDLRDTRATLYLKEITKLTVAAGFRPHLFIDDYDESDNSYCGWFVREPLRLGRGDWAFNSVDLVNDERSWARYSNTRSLNQVLGNVGFIGVMYFGGSHEYADVDACGILGIDEFRYNIPIP
jgi:hypothetical protein